MTTPTTTVLAPPCVHPTVGNNGSRRGSNDATWAGLYPTDRERCLAYASRMRAEYLEMPGLSRTPEQAARLWQVERELAAGMLATLTLAGFLRETPAHRFVRA